MEVKQRASVKEYQFNPAGDTGFHSYFYQVRETLKFKPKTVLVIGQGDNIVPSILRGLVYEHIEVDTFDMVADMNPTYVGDIREIDRVIDRKYDVIVCCDVLEHLPFDEFSGCLEKIKKLSNSEGGAVLSIPVFGLAGYIKVWTPKYIRFTIPISIRYYKPGKKVISSDHHWEINDLNGVKKRDVVRKIEEHFKIISSFRAKDAPYHMFFAVREGKK